MLRFVGQAVLSAVGDGIVGDLLIDELPGIAEETWSWWSKDRHLDQRRAEVEALIQAQTDQVRQTVAKIITDIAPNQPREVREALTTYLSLVPVSIRHSLRRPTDPTGSTLPSRLALRQAEDLLPFLPVRVPHFRPGERPLPGADWELEEILGIGGLSEVWKARKSNRSSAQAVALKFCVDPPSAKVLRNEARLLDRLMLQGRHPGIVALRQTYLSAEPPCLEYEYVAGGDLAGAIYDWLRRRHRPTPSSMARVVLRLAKIIGFAHRLDPPIVHRDLKPANILVHSQPDSSLALRIADFGNSGVAASEAIRQTLRGTTQARMLVSAVRGACTPLYASPQQMRGADADPRDDVYSLGVIWHQLLTGDLRSGRPEGRRWSKRLTQQGMAPPLVDLLTACFAENPDDRPRNAAVLAEQLAAVLKDGDREAVSPVAAAPPPDLQAAVWPRRITNSVNMSLTLIPAGTFLMGSPATEPERGDDEGPQHEVTIPRLFYLGMYPVTQRQYEVVMDNNPSYFTSAKGGGPDHPVERISWEEAVEFCRKLSALPAEKEAGRVYRLPAEAEWEYACRAGSSEPTSFGLTLSSREANFNGNYPYGITNRGLYLETTTKVGSYPPNPFGLYDMHGNVWEWCADYYDRNYYRASPRYDPQGPTGGTLRVVRGGSCCNIGRFCRSAYRFGVGPANRDLDVGMRVVMVPTVGNAPPQ